MAEVANADTKLPASIEKIVAAALAHGAALAERIADSAIASSLHHAPGREEFPKWLAKMRLLAQTEAITLEQALFSQVSDKVAALMLAERLRLKLDGNDEQLLAKYAAAD